MINFVNEREIGFNLSVNVRKVKIRLLFTCHISRRSNSPR